MENQDLDVKQKELVLKGIRKLLKDNLPDYMQIAFDANENGELKLFSEISRDKLMEMLIKDSEFKE